MNKVAFSLVLVVVLGLGLVPRPASGQGQIVVYFDTLLTQRSADSKGIGQLDTLFIAGQNFPFSQAGAVQYRVDYSAAFNHLQDLDTPGACPPGNNQSDTGIACAFGLAPRPAKKFLIQRVLVTWAVDASTPNIDAPVVLPNPNFADPTPIVIRFPDQAVFPAEGGRSQVNQFVELDIRPGTCPNPFNEDLWSAATETPDWKGGVIPVAVLGSATVDVGTIDPASCQLEGVPAASVGTIADVSTPDGTSLCDCNDLGGDGLDDLVLQFTAVDVAAQIPVANPGDTLMLTLTGAYQDGMLFSAGDCMIVIGGASGGAQPVSAAALGPATPNPFNPITRISYTVPTTAHVNLTVFDVSGRLLETLVDDQKPAGEYVVDWNATRLASGVYFYRLQVGDETIVRRATLLK